MAGIAEERLTMRVLVITGSFPPMKCGVGDYSYNLVKAIAAIPGTQVGVLTSNWHGAESVSCNGIDVFPVMDSWALSEASKVTRILRRWSPDIVHIQYPTQGYANAKLPWFLPLICFLMGNKVVQTWHEDLISRDVPKLLFRSMIPGGLVVVRPRYKERSRFFFRWALWNKRMEFIRNASVIPRSDLGDQDKKELRKKYLNGQRRLIVFFGFVNPNKGVELLLDIAEPASDQIVIAGEIGEAGNYQKEIARRAAVAPWRGKVTITGFLPCKDVAALLTVADAVILPFRSGGGEWNTSIHAAILQGTFVITTSLVRSGYDPSCNVYYANVDDVQAMKSALGVYAGRRREYDAEIDTDEWQQIATEHRSLYEHLLANVDQGKPAYEK
jgi:glycosyltransferase involved in cell wall biosynthesis